MNVNRMFLESLAIGALIVAAMFTVILGVHRLFEPDTPQIREITLTDGTPCVINKNGGIACNWRRGEK